MKFQVWDRISFVLIDPTPISPGLPYFAAAARRAFCYFHIRLYAFLGRYKKIVLFFSMFSNNNLAFGIDNQAVKIRRLNHIQTLSGFFAIRAVGTQCLVNCNCVQNGFAYIDFCNPIGLHFNSGFFTEGVCAGKDQTFDFCERVTHGNYSFGYNIPHVVALGRPAFAYLPAPSTRDSVT